MSDKITVVIPTLNEAGNISRLLTSLEKQEAIGQLWVIIADAGSTDGTLEEIQEFSEDTELNIIVVPGGLPSVARNNGSLLAETPYIVFIDSDVDLVSPRTLKRSYDALRNGKKLVTCKAMSNETELVIRAYYIGLNLAMRCSKLHKPFCWGAFMAIPTNVFRQMGGFDEEIKFGEDYMFSRRFRSSDFQILPIKISTPLARRLHRTGLFRLMRMAFKTFFMANNREIVCRDVDYWN